MRTTGIVDERTCGVPCHFCGGGERVEIADIWTDGTFQIECCCEAMHETVVHEMAEDPAWARLLLQRAGVEDLTGHRLRRLADDGACTMLLDYQLVLRTVSIPVARAFVARHHAHCGPPAVSRFVTGVFNGYFMLGVVMVGNPVARALNGRGVLEVNRLCVRRDVPAALAWNAASMLYGWAVREARQRGWAKIITYTRIDEAGTSLIAAGWCREGVVRGRGWHSAKRARSNTNAFIDKVRWSRSLHLRTAAPRDTGHPALPAPDLTRGAGLPLDLWCSDPSPAELLQRL